MTKFEYKFLIHDLLDYLKYLGNFYCHILRNKYFNFYTKNKISHIWQGRSKEEMEKIKQFFEGVTAFSK